MNISINKPKACLEALLVLSFLFFIFYILFPRLIFAQQALDISISPLFFEFSTEKGSVLKDKIRVRNNSSSSVTLQVGLQRLAAGTNNEASLSDPKPEDEFVRWVKLEAQTVTARPREWTDIPFTIEVPDDAAFGYYFAFLISQSASKEPGAVKLAGGVAIPVLLNVKTLGAVASGKLLQFAPKSFINEYLPVEFLVSVSNTGNVHIKPRGNIFVRSGGEKDLAILEVNQPLGSVLPQATRTFESAWMDGFLVREPIVEDGKVVKDEKGGVKTKLTVNWNKLTEFRFGRYTGHLLMVYDDGTRDVAMEGSTTFWVIPYKVIGGLILGIIILIFLLRSLLRGYVAREAKKYRG